MRNTVWSASNSDDLGFCGGESIFEFDWQLVDNVSTGFRRLLESLPLRSRQWSRST